MSDSNNIGGINVGPTPQVAWLQKNWFKVTLGVIAAILLIWIWSSYNGLVRSYMAVNQSGADLAAQYQRRMDMIPNLVKIVEASGLQERDTLREVTEARASATKMVLDPSKMTAADMQRLQDQQGQLGMALGRLMVASERYPQLQSIAGFRQLQSQLEGTENRIAVARRDYNRVATGFNTAIAVFPSNVINNSFNRYPPVALFKEEAGAASAPQIQFNSPAKR